MRTCGLKMSMSMLLVGCFGLVGGCAVPVVVTVDDDFAITLSDGASSAIRSGISDVQTNEDVFTCRSTSMSADLLTENAYFPTEPNHRMTLTNAIAGMTVLVTSDSEIVLWIRASNGNFCNESMESQITRGSWSPGDYDIFIGSPTPGESIIYTLVTN